MGVWALQQARALARQPDVELRVLSFSSWIPRLAGRFSAGARAYSHCPPQWDWDGLTVEYPRWLLSPVGPLKKMAFKRPEPQMSLAFVSARPYLEKVIREWKPDIIFAHHTMANGYLSEKITRKYNIPFVTLDHDFGEISDCEHYPARYEAFKRITGRASHVLAVSRRMEDNLNRLFPEAQVTTQHNSVEPIPESLWGIPRPPELQDKTIILAAGMFYERKGFVLLVEAFARIADKYPNTILRLAGDGETSAAVDAAIKRNGLEGQVQRLGRIAHEQLLQEMVWADVFALIGWDEPFGVVFGEAAAARCCIVWANDGGINDILEHGVHGLSVIPRDLESATQALEEILANSEKRRKMADNSYTLFHEKFNADIMASSLISLFSNIIQRERSVA